MTTARKKFELDVKQVVANLAVVESKTKALEKKIFEAAAKGGDAFKKLGTGAAAQLEQMTVQAQKLRHQLATMKAPDPAPMRVWPNLLSQAGDSANFLGISLSSVAQAALSAAQAFVGLALEGEKALALSASFTAMGGSVKDLEKLREATQNLIPDSALVQMSNYAKSFGISGEAAQKMAAMSIGASKKFGTDATKNFNDFVIATARGSRQIADNLGIQIPPLKELHDAYKRQHGITGDLTAAQKSAAFQAAMLKGGTELLTAAHLNTADSVQKMAVAYENLKGKVATTAAIMIDSQAKMFGLSRSNKSESEELAEAYKQLSQAAKDGFSEAALDKLVDSGAVSFMVRTAEEAADELERVKERMESLGLDTTETSKRTLSFTEELRANAKTLADNARKTEGAAGAVRLFRGAVIDARIAMTGIKIRLDETEKRWDEASKSRTRRHQRRVKQLQKEQRELDKWIEKNKEAAQQEIGKVVDFTLGESVGFGRREGGILEALGLGIEEEISMLERLGVMKDALLDTFGPGVANSVDLLGDSFLGLGDSWLSSSEHLEKLRGEMEEAAASGLQFGKSLGDTLANSESFRDGMANVMGDLFGKLASTYAAAAAAEIGLLTGNPFAAAAAAALLGAAASALTGAIKKSVSGSSSSAAAAQAPRRNEERRAAEEKGMTVIIEHHGLSMRDEDAKSVGAAFGRFLQMGGRV